MFQYKLFKIYNKNKENTIENINNIFKSDHIWEISENVIAISYDYGIRDYKYVLKQMLQLNVSQIIITSNIVMKFIDEVINNNFIIDELSFIESIPLDDQKFINKIVRTINLQKDKKEKMNLKNDLFEELKWLTTDGCIDVEHIDIEIKQESDYKKVKLYNNGIILFDNEDVKSYLNPILSEVFRRI